ncbi:MAG: hydrogenase expression/formation protein HypE [Clostridia bacterium]|nr:hydrogenase expression/formation protein HypE [Clostridia bacterium]
MKDIITLAHGSGGKLTHNLISELFHKYFSNDLLLESGDAAVFDIDKGRMAFTTDSYVITPIFFKGGNIGKLAVCGTVNDLAVSGAKPLYLSCGFILEEGFPVKELEEIVKSMAETALEAGVAIVTGDTKVVQKGGADRLFINTSGVGVIADGISYSPSKIQEGDKIIISGTMGDHGTAILLEREKFQVQSSIQSDCAPLSGMIDAVLKKFGSAVRVMRDPTRGGVATTLNELVKDRSIGIRISEDELPVKDEVKGICEMLGLEPLYMANEGKILLAVDSEVCEEILKIMKEHPYGRDAAVIGEAVKDYPGKVFMHTLTGGNRIIDMLVGDQLPRIC